MIHLQIHLHTTSLTVRCLVCDQRSSNIRALKFLGFSSFKQRITHPTTGAKLYIIFDPPHLKNVRNK